MISNLGRDRLMGMRTADTFTDRVIGNVNVTGIVRFLRAWERTPGSQDCVISWHSRIEQRERMPRAYMHRFHADRSYMLAAALV